MSKARLVVLLLCSLLPVACTTTTHPPALQLPNESPNKVIYPSSKTSPAVVDLLNKAQVATRNGHLQRAEVLLERTVRIEPRNPALWNYLAKLRLYQGRLHQAIGLAEKANALAGNDNKLRSSNWRIIAHAHYKEGDMAAASAAQKKADALWKP